MPVCSKDEKYKFVAFTLTPCTKNERKDFVTFPLLKLMLNDPGNNLLTYTKRVANVMNCSDYQL